MLADAVGLGKTVQARMVLRELMLRRRIRRVLVLCPASLRTQWRDEMDEKFSLSFDFVDRPHTLRLQRELGLDANPWRVHERIIASYHYLKQPDVLEQFRGTAEPGEDGRLRWDLLIVDEAHNLAPSSFGEDSDLAQMLQLISPWFEHRVFLTATPHNGHTRSFSGLLEALDPVRFTRKSELEATDRSRVSESIIRRLKSEINQAYVALGEPPRFSERIVDALPVLRFGAQERGLSDAFRDFRKALHKATARASASERAAAAFALEVLQKRLLSGPWAFGQSWLALLDGLRAHDAGAGTLDTISKVRGIVQDDTEDDTERESRERQASRTSGAWLRNFREAVDSELDDVTYAQSTSFDLAYFREPLKLLGGAVEPPRFNLKNALLVEKHVHACVLTALYGLARRLSEGERLQIEEVLARCFPSTLKPYLFTPGGEVRSEVLDISELGALLRLHRDAILRDVERAFRAAWPEEDADAVSRERLESIVDGMPSSLAEVLRRFKRRLDWARGELSRLAREEAQKGVLDPEDQAHRRRCQRVIERLKGQAQRTRAQAQGGGDDSDTMGALAREGFLPGYGLESGSIIGTAEPPRMTQGLGEFDLPRAPTIALREYVPGNAIYANGFRFVPRRFQLSPDDTMRLRVDAAKQVVSELGGNDQAAPLGAEELRAVPVCDVLLPSQSQISDEEDFRFQMPVAVYALERGAHRGGMAWTWGETAFHARRAVQLRMVNVGPKGEVGGGRIGYLLCLACGQSHSPYASQRSRDEFRKKHEERCNHRVGPTGFFVDVEVDVFGLQGATDAADAFSLVEAIRMGAARVLDMEVEDRQITSIGHAGDDPLDVLLYDPMPGGSGLLEQLVLRWPEVREAALAIVQGCASACERSCIDCLQTYRNRFYHQYLDRHRAKDLLERGPSTLTELHPIPERLPRTMTTVGQPQTVIEQRFKRFLIEAGLPTPEAQRRIDLGGSHHTLPDFFYPGEEADEPGIAIFLDGMAGHIHGNPEQAERDRFLREKLRSLGYEVVEVRSFELDDRAAVVAAVARVAKYLLGREKQRAVRDDSTWFDRARGDGKVPGRVLRLVRTERRTPDSVPIVALRAAAGAFSEGQNPEAVGFGRVEGITHRSGFFVAQVIGDSMNEVAPHGAWCLWEHLGAGSAPPAPGQNLLVRRPDEGDADFGEYTFKHLAEGPDGRYLAPRSTNPAHRRIPLAPDAEVQAIARFIAVLEEGDGEGPFSLSCGPAPPTAHA
ncbi:SNF2-related protein [Sorangium sp. So ce295]|uniref:SNF2-related protein n=1 Tax=Sorangium sp. So ce295 TaxID=3133295 RepID=UPI003F619FBF